MTRYHALLVVLHWILVIMILLAIVVGGPSLADMDNSDPEKMTGLTGHMIWGIVVGTLLVIRLVTRVMTRKPPPAETGNALHKFGGAGRALDLVRTNIRYGCDWHWHRGECRFI